MKLMIRNDRDENVIIADVNCWLIEVLKWELRWCLRWRLKCGLDGSLEAAHDEAMMEAQMEAWMEAVGAAESPSQHSEGLMQKSCDHVTHIELVDKGLDVGVDGIDLMA